MTTADVSFSRPSCRVIRCTFDKLESEIRKRTAYDLRQVVRYEAAEYDGTLEMFILFFFLKPDPLTVEHPPERIENASPP